MAKHGRHKAGRAIKKTLPSQASPTAKARAFGQRGMAKRKKR